MGSKWYHAVFVLFQLLTGALVFFGQQIETSPNGGPGISVSTAISKAAGTMIHVNIAILILVNCRLLTWLFQRAFGYSIDATRPVFASIMTFSIIHIGTYLAVPTIWYLKTKLARNAAALTLAIIQTGVAWSGLTLSILFCPASAIITLRAGKRISNPLGQRYLNSLCLIFLAVLATHEAFCIPDWSSNTFLGGSDSFWNFWLPGGLILLLEGIVRTLRPQQKARVLKVNQHPNGVLEVQFEKLALRPAAGQSIILSCPTASVVQKYQLPLTSAPEDDYLSVHIPPSQNATRSLATSLGPTSANPTRFSQNLPHFYMDGISGVESEDVFGAHVAILVGSGYGVFSMASVLKSVWYRMISPRKATMLHTVYFFWICEDIESFKWFQALLMAIEAANLQIEIYLYLTAPFDEAKATKHLINSAVNRIDLVTGLRNPTRHGDPDWRQIFSDIAQYHEKTKPNTHVLYSGPGNFPELDFVLREGALNNDLGKVGFSKIRA